MGLVARVWVCIGVSGALLSLLSTSSPASAQSALLGSVSTRVSLAHSGGRFDDVTAERIIRSGDTVATDATGRAVVTYPDGSTALLEENSILTIEFVRTSAGDYAVRMQQTLGRVWYAVTRAVTLGSRYEVRTAAMASVIRAGSNSSVSVTPTGETTIVTIEGTVDTSAGGVELAVPAGSSTTVSGPGDAPSASTPASSPGSAFAPTSTAAPAPARTSAPSPTNALVPSAPAPALPVSTTTPKPKPSLTALRIPTPEAAPTPLPAPLKDKFGPRKDAPGQPPPKPN